MLQWRVRLSWFYLEHHVGILSRAHVVTLLLCLTSAKEGLAHENKDKKSLTSSCPTCCSVTASFMLWFPWEQGSIFPSRRSRAPHHIKYCSHESGSRSTGSLTLAELTAYMAVCTGGVNGLWFPIWPSWVIYLMFVNLAFCPNTLNAYSVHIKSPANAEDKTDTLFFFKVLFSRGTVELSV